MTRSTEQVFSSHKDAILTGDFPKLLADYADESLLLTMDGTFAGKAAIEGFFQNLLSGQPNARVAFGNTVAEGDTLLLDWSAESDVATMPQGIDTFIIQDDKIQRPTIWFMVVPNGT